MMEEMARPVFNIWTFLHFLVGFGFGTLGMPAKLAIPTIILWEVIEQTLLVSLQICGPPELLLDSIIDIIVGLIGYVFGLMINKRIKKKSMYKKYIDIF